MLSSLTIGDIVAIEGKAVVVVAGPSAHGVYVGVIVHGDTVNGTRLTFSGTTFIKPAEAGHKLGTCRDIPPEVSNPWQFFGSNA